MPTNIYLPHLISGNCVEIINNKHSRLVLNEVESFLYKIKISVLELPLIAAHICNK